MGDQRCRQEVKIALANRPSEPWSLVLSRARAWAWVQELFWGLGESHSLEEGPLLPTLPPSLSSSSCCRSLPSLQRKEGKGGRRGKREGGGRRRRAQGWLSEADSLMSGPVESLGGPRAQHSSPKPPLPCLAPPEAAPMRRPVCSGRSDPEWLSWGSPGGGAPFSPCWQQPERPLRLMQ